MKNILLILSFVTLISACKKDKIYPRDRKDDCKNCVIQSYDNNGNVIDEITYNEYEANKHPLSTMTWCEYLDLQQSNGFTDLASNPIDGKLNCR